MEFERKRYEHTHMNIAPLVDVVFLLLLFFMLSSHFMQEPSIKIKLPESKTAASQKEEVKTIFITKDGKIYLMDQLVDIATLGSKIRRLVENSESNFVRIKADKESNVGLLVSVIDEVRLAGTKTTVL